MRVGVFVNTPAQVHFYKNIVRILIERGNSIYLLARDYGETISLLNEMNLDYYIYSKPPNSKYGKIVGLPFDVLRAYNYLKRFDIDIVTGFGSFDAYTSFLLRVPAISFNDSEPSAAQIKLYMPFVAAIITPDSFRENLGPKQIRVCSYKEMAYLHPRYYQPKDGIFNLLGLEQGEEYAILRFNAFEAVHDLGIDGFSDGDKVRLVRELEKYTRVFISSEAEVPDEIKDRVMKIPKNRIHDAIHYACLLVTDTQTMTTESAILGTPAIRCNHFVGTNDMSNFIELEKKYGLIYNYRVPDKVIEKAVDLIKKPNLKEEWKAKRERLLSDKVDMTKYMVDFIENYSKRLGKTPQILS